MTPRSSGRVVGCDRAAATSRLTYARSTLTLAEVAAVESDKPGYTNAAVSNAVLAGIAASDALTCMALGQRSRSQDHGNATTLLAQVSPDGPALAKDLARLLSYKDTAQYSETTLTSADVTAAIRRAAALVDAATERSRT